MQHTNSQSCRTKPPRRRLLLVTLVAGMVVMLSPRISFGQQATLTNDAHTSSAAPATNFGGGANIIIAGPASAAGASNGFLKFNLTKNLPPGTTGNVVAKATLKLYL